LKPDLEQNMLPFTVLLLEHAKKKIGYLCLPETVNQFMKTHMNHHALVSNHLILDTKH